MATTRSCDAPPAPSEPGDGLFGASDLSQVRLLKRNRRFFVAAFTLCVSNGLLFRFGNPGPTRWLAIGLALVAVALAYPLVIAAAKALVRLQLSTEVFISAALVTVLLVQHWWYASWVVSVMWFGEFLMSWAGLRARSAVEALLELVPRQARVIGPEGSTSLVPVDAVKPGQIVDVRAGESIPVDGVVTRGETTVDLSMLTGESMPVDVGVGGAVYAGTHNLVGTIRVRTETVAAQNTVAQIVTMMRKAQTHQIPIPRTVDRFIRWFFPLALAGGLVVLAVTGSMERMAAILLVLAPCAFSAATPLVLVATIGNAARYGIMIKNGPVIEALPRAGVALLDKTGTLTTSSPALHVIDTNGVAENDLLAKAAAAESAIASHPLARAILDAAAGRGITVADPDSAEVANGNGVVATLDGRRIAVGNLSFMQRIGLVVPVELEGKARQRQDEGHSLAYVAIDGEIRGVLGFLALPRPSAHAVVHGLRRFGLKRLVMLTGDQSKPAQVIADQLGLEVVSEASPQAKLDEVMRWRSASTSKRSGIVMVGDGINDAGALAAANVGIAMGSTGAEVAAAAADIVIHGDRFSRVLTAAKLARHGLRMIRLNIFFAFIFNLVGLILAAPGLISTFVAQVFGMTSFLSVVINSALVLAYRPRTIDDGESAGAVQTRPTVVVDQPATA